MAINNRRDIMLLLLYSPGATGNFNEPIAGRTRLVKMLFLFKQEVLREFRRGTEITDENFYQFFPWDFGPFSVDVYDDLTFFTLRGFVQSTESDEDPLPESAEEWDMWLSTQPGAGDDEVESYSELEFRLTDKGEAFARQLYECLNEQQRKLLRTFKARLTTSPLRAILRYVYSTYDSMTRKSKIRDDVLGPNH